MCIAATHSNGLVNHACRLIEHCLTNKVNPEGFLSAVMQLINKLLTCPKYLVKRKISHVKLYSLYEKSQTIAEFAHFAHTIRFLFLKLTLKYLSFKMHDEAVYLALNTKQPEIVRLCEAVFNSRMDAASLALLREFEKEQN